MRISEFQEIIRATYIHHDSKRGIINTLLWLKSEVDELEKALMDNDVDAINEEFADVLAWLASLANLLDVDLELVSVRRYGSGCPKCRSIPCKCTFRASPSELK